MKDRIARFFVNIATSGRYAEHKEFGMSDYLIRYVLLNFIGFFGSLILAIYTVYNIVRAEPKYVVAAVCAGMMFIALAVPLFARTRVRQIIPASIVMIFYGLFCIYLVWTKQTDGVNFLFIYVYPLVTIMLLGMRFGVILSTVLLVITTALMFFSNFLPDDIFPIGYDYSTGVWTRMLATYLLVFLVMIVIEFTRKTKDKLIKSQSLELQKFNDNLQKMVEEKTQDVYDLQNALLKTMAELVEYRDNITGSHIERTQKGLELLLDEITKDGLYADEIKNLNTDLLIQSCQLHDIGKISISDNVLKKPAKLSDEEFKEMKGHVTFGEEIIENIEALTKKSDFLKNAKVFIASHHEKWDGSGYPRGLKGNEIPLLGRLMAIVDVYDALTSVRPYKKAFTHEEAIRILIENKGTQFEPLLVDMFIRAMESEYRDTGNASHGK